MEEWNEFGELKENIGPVPAGGGDTSAHRVATGVSTAPPIPVNPTATKGTANLSQPPVNKAPPPGVDESKFRALPGAAEMAERGKAQPASTSAPSQGAVSDENAPPPKGVETMASAPAEKQESVTAAKKLLRAVQGNGGRAEHLSAPPSGVATPEGEKADVAAAAKEEEKEQSTGAGEEEGKVEGESGVRDAAAEEVQGRSAGGEVEEAQRVGATDAGEGKVAEEVGAQSAKEGGDAGKSVGD